MAKISTWAHLVTVESLSEQLPGGRPPHHCPFRLEGCTPKHRLEDAVDLPFSSSLQMSSSS